MEISLPLQSCTCTVALMRPEDHDSNGDQYYG